MSEQRAIPGGDAPPRHPIRVVVTDDLQRNRLTVFFRLFLYIPAGIALYLLTYVAQLIAFGAWFYALFVGKLHPGLRDILVYWLRYQAQAIGYVCLLTQRYPSFSEE